MIRIFRSSQRDTDTTQNRTTDRRTSLDGQAPAASEGHPEAPSSSGALRALACGRTPAAPEPLPTPFRDSRMSTWAVGDLVLDLYEVRDVIATGGMGVVHRVWHRGWDVEFAVKSPKAEFVASPTGMRNFETEAHVWVGLGAHPNTVGCVYVRRIDDLPRVFAEWVNGGDLATAISGRRLYAGGSRAASARILDVAIQVARGLEHAHRHRLVHQDVKPANVLLSGGGGAKVTDFGLARARAAGSRSAPVPDGVSLVAQYAGMTPAFCSPEQARAAVVDPDVVLTRATDVWSWALTVLAMFNGGPPTRFGQAGAQVLAAFREQTDVDPRIPPLPPGVADLLAGCLVEDPTVRPRDMNVLALALADLYEDLLGAPYLREQPVASVLRADGLGNQALSLLDLGQPDRAELTWEQALRSDPHHVHSTYNRALHAWRRGRILDDQVIAQLAAVGRGRPDDPLVGRLLSLIHLERGDPSATESLVEVLHNGRGDQNVRAADAAPASGSGAPVRLDHGRITAVALNADGSVAVTGGGLHAHCVLVWDASTGRLTGSLPPHQFEITTVAVSATGDVVVAGDRGGVVRVVTTTGGEPVLTMTHPAVVDSVAVSPDGRRVLSADVDGSVHEWDVRSRRAVMVPDRQRRPAAPPVDRGMAPTGGRPGGRWSVVGTDGDIALHWFRGSGELRVWGTASREVQHVMYGQFAPVVVGAGGGVVLADHTDGTAQLYNAGSGALLRTLHHSLGQVVAIAGTGGFAVTGSEPGVEVRLWDLDPPRCRLTRSEAGHRVSAVAVSHDGRWAVAAATDGSATVWPLPPPGPTAPWSYARPRGADQLQSDRRSVAEATAAAERLTSAGRLGEAGQSLRAARSVAGYGRDRDLLQAWRTLGRAGSPVELVGAWRTGGIGGGTATVTSLHADAGLVVRGGADGSVRILDIATGRSRRSPAGHTGPVRALSADPRARVGLSGGADGQVLVWDLASGQCRYRLPDHGGAVPAMVVSRDACRALVGGQDHAIRVWDLSSGRLDLVLDAGDGHVSALALSANGRTAASASITLGRRPHLVGFRVWDLVTGQRTATLGGDRTWFGETRHLEFSADGRLVLSHIGSDLDVWDIASGRRHRVAGVFLPMTMSPDGSVLLTVRDAVISAWDLSSGDALHVMEGHHGRVTALAVDRRSRFMVSASTDRAIRVWDLLTGRSLCVLEAHSATPHWLDIDADGHTVVSADEAEVVTWELDWEYDFAKGSDLGALRGPTEH